MNRFLLSAFSTLAVILGACGPSPAQVYYGPRVGPLYANPYGFRGGGIGYSYPYNRAVYPPAFGYSPGLARLYAPGLTYRYGIYPGIGYSPLSYRLDPLIYRVPWQPPDPGTITPPDYSPLTAPGPRGLTGDVSSGAQLALYPPGPLPHISPPDRETAPRRARARLTVRVPAGAELWFGDYQSKQTGTDRIFQTPPLEVGAKYTYKVRLHWTEGDRPREVTRDIDVRAGEERTIDLRKDEGK